MLKHCVIAIDGPAGSGKSTISKLIAEELKLLYIDTGAMYRALTLKAMRLDVDLEDADALTRLAVETKIDLVESDGAVKVMLDGEDVSPLIRTPELTNMVKFIARVPGVRREMVKVQRSIGERRDSILEGRDITTVVFPDAAYKFYLDANVEERARRRHAELVAAGNDVTFEQLRDDIVVRDESDVRRKVGALKRSDDAVYIDTTGFTIGEVAQKVLAHIRGQVAGR